MTGSMTSSDAALLTLLVPAIAGILGAAFKLRRRRDLERHYLNRFWELTEEAREADTQAKLRETLARRDWISGRLKQLAS